MKTTINSDEDLLGFCYLFILEKMRHRRYQQTSSEVMGGNSDKDGLFRGKIAVDKAMDSTELIPRQARKS